MSINLGPIESHIGSLIDGHINILHSLRTDGRILGAGNSIKAEPKISTEQYVLRSHEEPEQTGDQPEWVRVRLSRS